MIVVSNDDDEVCSNSFLLTCSRLLTCNLTFQQESFWKRGSSQRRRFMVHSILVHSIDRRIQFFDIFCLNKPSNTYPPYPTEDWKDREWETRSSKKSLKVRKESNRMFESAPYFQCLNDFSMMICQDQKRPQIYIFSITACVCQLIFLSQMLIRFLSIYHGCVQNQMMSVVSPKLD